MAFGLMGKPVLERERLGTWSDLLVAANKASQLSQLVRWAPGARIDDGVGDRTPFHAWVYPISGGQPGVRGGCGAL